MKTWFVGCREFAHKKHREADCRALKPTTTREVDADAVRALDKCGHCCDGGTDFPDTQRTSLRSQLYGGGHE